MAVAIALLLTAWGCGSDDTHDRTVPNAGRGADLPRLTVVARDHHGAAADPAHAYRFDLPNRVRAGATRISLVNHGHELHHAQLFKLRPEATVDRLTAALATDDPFAALKLGSYRGGTGAVAAGRTSRADAIVDLSEGTYVLLCFIEAPDGTPHVSRGMVRAFRVTNTGRPVVAPKAALTIDMVDFGFDLPATMSGHALVRVTNKAVGEAHEMTIARLAHGATVADVGQALTAGQPPPVTPVGGMQALMPGEGELLQLDLQPGRYVVWCSVPSPTDGKAHFAKGMLGGFTVT